MPITFSIELVNMHLVEKISICGSIRRKKPEVNDADIIVLPKLNKNITGYLKNFHKCIRAGNKIVTVTYRGLDIDVYIATPENFGVLQLIRTGSAEHNKKLCTLALKKGWKLWADGSGLRTGDGDLISNTEIGILEKLLGKYVEPEERE